MEEFESMNTAQEIPPRYIEPIREEDTINFSFHETVDKEKSVIRINGELWNTEPLSIHEAKEFIVEFELADKDGQPIHSSELVLEGDTIAPAIRTNVPEKLYYTKEIELHIETDEDVKEQKIYVNDELQKGPVRITENTRTIRIEAMDQAGNSTSHTVEVMELPLVQIHADGRTLTWTGLGEDITLYHNGEPVTGESILLEQGKHSISVNSPWLLEPVEIEQFEYAPVPVHLSAAWKEGFLNFETSRPVQSAELVIDGKQYDALQPVAWEQTASEQQLSIKAVMKDEEGNVFEQLVTTRIDAKKKEEPVVQAAPILQPPAVVLPVSLAPALRVEPVAAEPALQPIVLSSRSSLKNELLLEKKITLDPDKKVSMEISGKKIDKDLQIELANEQLVRFDGNTGSRKVRVILARDDLGPGSIESVAVNEQPIDPATLQKDRLGQLYFEMETEPMEYTIHVTYKDGENKVRSVQNRFTAQEKKEGSSNHGYALLIAAIAPLVYLIRRLSGTHV